MPKGQKTELVLPDNTHIWLNSDSRLRYASNFGKGKDRQVELSGEAYFEVSKNKKARFTVQLPNASVTVFGTKFNVKAYRDEKSIETSLVEGSVSFTANPQSSKPTELMMKPGDQVRYNYEEKAITTARFGETEITGWRKNQLVFADDDFTEVVRKIERWYDVKIVYDKASFQGQRLSLQVLEEENIEQLMKIIGKVMHISYEIDHKTITVRPG